ncbi:MAG: hypothetical protein J2P36_14875 [Ktedonobacteraceae bacterium]|nr:hypothetical protein [Ktedonobacteraceae bacterium]
MYRLLNEEQEFYNFLLAERNRLRQEGKPSGAAAEAGKSALIISLLAAWLNPDQQPTYLSRGCEKRPGITG